MKSTPRPWSELVNRKPRKTKTPKSKSTKYKQNLIFRLTQTMNAAGEMIDSVHRLCDLAKIPKGPNWTIHDRVHYALNERDI